MAALAIWKFLYSLLQCIYFVIFAFGLYFETEASNKFYVFVLILALTLIIMLLFVDDIFTILLELLALTNVQQRRIFIFLRPSLVFSVAHHGIARVSHDKFLLHLSYCVAVMSFTSFSCCKASHAAGRNVAKMIGGAFWTSGLTCLETVEFQLRTFLVFAFVGFFCVICLVYHPSRDHQVSRFRGVRDFFAEIVSIDTVIQRLQNNIIRNGINRRSRMWNWELLVSRNGA